MNNRYDGSGYTGSGYHEDIKPIPTLQGRIIDDDIKLFNQPTVYSQEIYKNSQLSTVLDQWEKYNKVTINSWDLAHSPGVDGTILRFAQESKFRSLMRSPDFRFSLQTNGFQKNFRSNMDRLREEVDASLALARVDNIARLSGATDCASIQLLMIEQQFKPVFGWLAIADQLFIPLTNRWTERITSQYPYMNFEQSTKKYYGIRAAIDLQRKT